MDIVSLIGTALASIFCFVTILFCISLILKRNDIADVAWGSGIFLVAFISYLLSDRGVTISVVTALIFVWGARLSVRIFLRNRKKGEDFRYTQWRETWGKWFYPRSYVQVYLLQGFLMCVVGYPALLAGAFSAGQQSLGLISFAGVCIWAIGFLFESVGDYQLDRYINAPGTKPSVLRSGLWRYSRHPNYFGEVTMWWGIWLTVFPLPFGFFAIVSPLMITFLILKVSGIPMLEKKFDDNEAFQDYKKVTSAFFPFPPRT